MVGQDFAAGVHVSAWLEPQEDNVVKVAHTLGESAYQMTASGWSTAVLELQMHQDPAYLEKCSRLRRALKAGADKATDIHPVFAHVDEIGQEYTLEPGWVQNVVSSNLLTWVFPKHRINATPHRQDPRLIEIPGNFGRKFRD